MRSRSSRTISRIVSFFVFALYFVILAIPLPAVAVAVAPDAGVTAGEILFGTSTNMAGVTPGVADEYNVGITAYINKINEAGGIHGRKLRRLILNDDYDPADTLRNVKQLVDTDRVFALLGMSSTTGIAEILPFVRERNIPVFAPYSSGDFLRKREETQIFNVKAGQIDQIETLMKLAVYSMGLKSVCAFYQDDRLGQTAVEEAESVLLKSNLTLTAKSSTPRASVATDEAVQKLKAAGCKAVLLAAQDRQAKSFVQAAQKAEFHPSYFGLNLIATGDFMTAVKGFKEDFFISMTTPIPTETVYSIVREFNKDVQQLNPKAQLTATTLEGYLAGAILEYVLKRAGPQPTREKLKNELESMKDADIGGLKFTFNKANRQATSRVLLCKIQNGQLGLFN